MLFDFNEIAITDILVTDYIKGMVGFRIIKIKANENLDICMLIEHDCLCQIKFWNENEVLMGGLNGIDESPASVEGISSSL